MHKVNLTSEPEVESADEQLMQLIRRSPPMVNVGDYILVKFTKYHSVSYFADKVVRVDRAGEETRTTFLKRNDMRKSDVAITFCWPEQSDLAWHDEDDRRRRKTARGNIGWGHSPHIRQAAVSV